MFYRAGCILREGNCLPCSGVSGRAVVSPRRGDHRLLRRGQIILRRCDSRRRSFACAASSSQRKNPDFSRQSKGFSRGRSRQNQDRDNSDNSDDAADLLTSKNGPLLSLSSNPRHQATAAPGQREKEIVELFRKVQAQLRERAAVKEEKKMEAASTQGQGERGTVDSLLKLLRKHSVDQGKKKGGGEKSYEVGQPDRSSPFEDAQNSSFFESSSMVPEEDVEETAPPPPFTRRPPSNFQRRSPVPRVKYQPVYSAEELNDVPAPQKSAGKKKAAAPEPDEEEGAEEEDEEEPISLDEREAFDDEPSDDSDAEEEEGIARPRSAESTDLSSLKLSELRALAKSRGMKGYSKLKKSELLELLASSEGDR